MEKMSGSISRSVFHQCETLRELNWPICGFAVQKKKEEKSLWKGECVTECAGGGGEMGVESENMTKDDEGKFKKTFQGLVPHGPTFRLKLASFEAPAYKHILHHHMKEVKDNSTRHDVYLVKTKQKQTNNNCVITLLG